MSFEFSVLTVHHKDGEIALLKETVESLENEFESELYVVNKTWEASQQRLNALSAEQKMDLQIAWTRQHDDGHRIKVLEQMVKE